MTYEQFNQILDAAQEIGFEAMARAKADDRLMVSLGQDRGFASIEALGISADDVAEHAPHCLATVAQWRQRAAASEE